MRRSLIGFRWMLYFVVPFVALGIVAGLP
ncbi:MAG: hypothetical protein UW80_C0024G0001, partial [Microgenomates group bacterium GW2011_GWC1_44_9]